MKPYYTDDFVTLYHGDCRDVRHWLDADVLVTDPPYGMDYASRYSGDAVIGDTDTNVRDAALDLWGGKPALVCGSWRNAKPVCDQVLVWDKREEASLGHPVFFSAHEEIYVIGSGWVGPRRSNVLRVKGIPRGASERKALRHPTPKPVALFTAAKALGRKAIGVELDEDHCYTIAGRLSQNVLDLGGAA